MLRLSSDSGSDVQMHLLSGHDSVAAPVLSVFETSMMLLLAGNLRQYLHDLLMEPLDNAGHV